MIDQIHIALSELVTYVTRRYALTRRRHVALVRVARSQCGRICAYAVAAATPTTTLANLMRDDELVVVAADDAAQARLAHV